MREHSTKYCAGQKLGEFVIFLHYMTGFLDFLLNIAFLIFTEVTDHSRARNFSDPGALGFSCLFAFFDTHNKSIA